MTRKTELLSLSKGNYQRLFMRKSANRSIEMLKNVMVSRLYLYIHRTQMSLHNASLLKYLTLKLRDPDSLKQLRSKHTRKPKGKQGKYKEYFYGAFNSRSYDKDEENIRSFLKTMGVYYITDNSLPELETSTRVLADLNAHLSDWLKRTRRKEKPEFREVLSPDSKAVKRYRLEVSISISVFVLFSFILNYRVKADTLSYTYTASNTIDCVFPTPIKERPQCYALFQYRQ